MFNRKKKENIGGLFIPAGLFIGMGFGFLIDEFVACMFVGLGLGFLGMLIYTIKKTRR